MSDLASTLDIVPWVAPDLTPIGRESKFDSNQSDGVQAPDHSDAVEESVLQKSRDDGYQEGYLKGYQEGQKNATESICEEREQLRLLLANMNRPLTQNDKELMQELLNLSLSMAKIIVNREVGNDASYYQQLISRFCEQYSQEAKPVVVSLHPEDLELIEACSQSSDTDGHLKLLADSSLSRGDCLIDFGQFYIDAGLDANLTRIASSLNTR